MKTPVIIFLTIVSVLALHAQTKKQLDKQIFRDQVLVAPAPDVSFGSKRLRVSGGADVDNMSLQNLSFPDAPSIRIQFYQSVTGSYFESAGSPAAPNVIWEVKDDGTYNTVIFNSIRALTSDATRTLSQFGVSPDGTIWGSGRPHGDPGNTFRRFFSFANDKHSFYIDGIELYTFDNSMFAVGTKIRFANNAGAKIQYNLTGSVFTEASGGSSVPTNLLNIVLDDGTFNPAILSANGVRTSDGVKNLVLLGADADGSVFASGRRGATPGGTFNRFWREDNDSSVWYIDNLIKMRLNSMGLAVADSIITYTGFRGDAGNLRNIPASQLTGTIADARLSANVPLLNGDNIFTGSNQLADLKYTNLITVGTEITVTLNKTLTVLTSSVVVTGASLPKITAANVGMLRVIKRNNVATTIAIQPSTPDNIETLGTNFPYSWTNTTAGYGSITLVATAEAGGFYRWLILSTY